MRMKQGRLVIFGMNFHKIEHNVTAIVKKMYKVMMKSLISKVEDEKTLKNMRKQVRNC